MKQCPVCGYELLPSDGQCPKCKGESRSHVPPTASARPPRTSGLAIAALAVGILSLFGIFALVVPGVLFGIIALILGIVALARINRNRAQLSGQGLAIAGVALGAFALVASAALAAVFYPVFVRARGAARTAICLSNAKQLSLGMQMYAADHNDRLPPAGTWSDSVASFVKKRETFVCPEARGLASGYAYNRALGDHAVKEISNPPQTVLLYEANLGWNGAAGAESLLSPPRHYKGNVVSFADGHVKVIGAQEQGQLVWQPEAVGLTR